MLSGGYGTNLEESLIINAGTNMMQMDIEKNQHLPSALDRHGLFAWRTAMTEVSEPGFHLYPFIIYTFIKNYKFLFSISPIISLYLKTIIH